LNTVEFRIKGKLTWEKMACQSWLCNTV